MSHPAAAPHAERVAPAAASPAPDNPDPRAGSPDPGARLETVFRTVGETRMAGLPILNPALSVEALGFRPVAGGWAGVLVTPWFMSLVYLPDVGPDGPPAWAARRLGSPQRLALPSGVYELLTAEEESLGPYLTGSLISPMWDFEDMDQARAAAGAVLAELFPPADGPPAGADEPASAPVVGLAARLEQPLSRRGFLGGLLGPED